MLAGRCVLLMIAANFCAVADALAAVVAPQTMLRPTKPWVLNYAETQCLATRVYDAPDGPLTFGIRPALNGESYELLLVFTRSGPRFGEELEGSVDFGQGEMKPWLLRYGLRPGKLDVYQFKIDLAQMAQARTARGVTLRAKGGPHVALSLSDMPDLLKGMAECTEDLKRYWNADGIESGKIKTPPRGDVRSLFTSQDYPEEAFSRQQEGTAQFVLLVNGKGRVEACHVLQPSGVPVFDVMGCQVIKERGRFRPALDQQGRPVRSTVTTPPVVWRMF